MKRWDELKQIYLRHYNKPELHKRILNQYFENRLELKGNSKSELYDEIRKYYKNKYPANGSKGGIKKEKIILKSEMRDKENSIQSSTLPNFLLTCSIYGTVMYSFVNTNKEGRTSWQIIVISMYIMYSVFGLMFYYLVSEGVVREKNKIKHVEKDLYQMCLDILEEIEKEHNFQ